MAHTWKHDRAADHIQKKIDQVKEVTVVNYKRETSLESIPSNKAYKVDGVHTYIDIVNLDDMLAVTEIEGETCHKRTLRFLNQHYRAVNRILARNGVAFEMLSNGRIVRILPPVLGDDLKRMVFRTGDRILDNMLEESRAKFTDRNPLLRREGLERLWDAWERLKSLADPEDKKKSIKIILDATAEEVALRQRLEDEAKELTDIGNSHLIRHTELKQIPVIDVDHVDYLFHRLFAMIQLLLRKKRSV